MSEQETVGGSTAEPRPSEGMPAASELVAAVNRLRRWLIALTAVVSLLVVAAVVGAVLIPRAIHDSQGEAFPDAWRYG